MERLNGNVGAFQGTLQEAPEVLAAVCVDLPIDIAFGVVDDVVDVVGAEAVIGQQFVSVDLGAAPDVLTHVGLQDVLPVAFYDRYAHGAVTVLAVTREQTLDGN